MNDAQRATIDALGISYSAEFVPQSKSRNAGKKEPSLNWRVTLKRNGVELVTDYTQGIGNMPGYRPRNTLDQDAARKLAAEHGKAWRGVGHVSVHSANTILPPNVYDVLYSLSGEATALDYTFDEWCREYGYDTDSRKADVMYRGCIDIGLTLRRMIGDDGLRVLRSAFEDY